MDRTAVVIGASGLTGMHLVKLMLQDNYFITVRLLVRRILPLIHPKLQQVIVDFNNVDDYRTKFGKGDIIFCCVGTTHKKVNGDHSAYAKVDFNIPINASGIGIEKGFEKYLLMSSVGANKNSKNFYLHLKGKVEENIKQFPFKSISILRPGQLLGKRTEHRRGEYILQTVTRFISHLLIGRLQKFRSIKAEDVARAMIAECKKTDPGLHILEYEEMMKLIR